MCIHSTFIIKASFSSYVSLGFKKFEIDMVSFPGLKKYLCGALKKAMGMECKGWHIPQYLSGYHLPILILLPYGEDLPLDILVCFPLAALELSFVEEADL